MSEEYDVKKDMEKFVKQVTRKDRILKKLKGIGKEAAKTISKGATSLTSGRTKSRNISSPGQTTITIREFKPAEYKRIFFDENFKRERKLFFIQ